MTSLNPPGFMVNNFQGFSIAIIVFVLVACEAKQDSSSKILCGTFLYPKPCSDLTPTPILSSKNGNENGNDLFINLYNLSMEAAMNEVSRVSEDFGENGWLTQKIKDIDRNLELRLRSCRELLSLALYNLNMSSMASVPMQETLVDFKTWICGTVANLETCLDGFEYAPEEARKIVIASMESSIKNVSHSFSILKNIAAADDHVPNLGSRKIMNEWPPSWMSSEERKLLVGSNIGMGINVVVAKDGSGKYKTINEAINVAPRNSLKRFVIYVKQGIYSENVKIDISRWNIMIFGDGMDKTIVSGKLSNSSGASTTDSATFVVHGAGFIARDIGFQNTAGPSTNQAVAFLSSSDKSILYKCKIDGYQDSLFTLSNRQFYRECRIYGTIDFIFGQSSAVFQNCAILAKKPLHGQSNTITAQGKFDPHCPSGFSIQNCDVLAAEDLAGARTFLGRPWKKFSTTVYMESFLDRLIDPQGWMQWRPNVAPPDTIYYGEYKNRGPGSVTTSRVPWKGVRVDIGLAEAKKFSVRQFISGVEWITATGVPFQPDL